MVNERIIVENYRTSGTTAPTSDMLTEGEIAIGMNPDLTRIWHKKTDNTVAEYVPLEYIDNLYATKEYVDGKEYSGDSYELVLNDDGSLECIKNETEEGFVLNTDGSLSLS